MIEAAAGWTAHGWTVRAGPPWPRPQTLYAADQQGARGRAGHVRLQASDEGLTRPWAPDAWDAEGPCARSMGGDGLVHRRAPPAGGRRPLIRRRVVDDPALMGGSPLVRIVRNPVLSLRPATF